MKQNFLSIFSVILLTFCFCSCVQTVRSPVEKNNKVFLSKYKTVIAQPKNRHKQIDSGYNIKYTDDIVKNTVDADYYNNVSVKNKKNFVAKNKSDEYKTVDVFNEDMEYLSQDKSIYKPESNLRDNKLDSLKEMGNMIAYLDENYGDYKQEQNNIDIDISSEAIYGSLPDRKNKKYYTIDTDELLVSYDYIDLLSRVRTDIYIQQKEGQKQQQRQQINSLKQKIMDMFGNIGKKK